MNKMGFCKYKKDQKFGNLTIIGYDSKKKNYICKCDCGNITNARGNAMIIGKHLRCKDCGEKSRVSKRILPDYLAIKKDLYKNYKQAAKRRGYDFHLTLNEFSNLIILECFYCGIEPYIFHKTTKRKAYSIKEFLYNGIDRVNNKEGYTKKNCVPCCKICNYSKAELSLDEWKIWINRVYNYQTKQLVSKIKRRIR